MFAPAVRYAGVSGVLGGVLWALTPLRQPIFDAGRSPEEGLTFFRLYNLVVILIAILLTVALIRLRRDPAGANGPLFATGWWTVLVGHVLIAVGSLPAVVLGDEPRSIVMGGQDLGFIGAMIAGLGGLAIGSSMVRHPARRSDVAAWLLVLTLPLGFLVLALLSTMGVDEDYLGLPLTMLYGSSWVVLGWSWIRERNSHAGSRPAARPRTG